MWIWCKTIFCQHGAVSPKSVMLHRCTSITIRFNTVVFFNFCFSIRPENMFRKSPDSTSDIQSLRQNVFRFSIHTSHCCGHNISLMPWLDFFILQHWLGPRGEWISLGWSNYQAFWPCDLNTSQSSQRNPLKFCTNICLDMSPWSHEKHAWRTYGLFV